MDAFFAWLVRSVEILLGFRTRITLTPEHKRCLRLLEHTNQNVFLTGKAGTGKSTLIEHFRENTKKNVVVLAPTGLAALNIRGQTVNSFFKFPPRILDASAVSKHVNKRLYKSVDCIIIDEVSMLRADVMDAIDYFLRLHGRDRSLPFGGVQIVLVGDMYQLPPVVTRQEQHIYGRMYETPYFFSAQSFNQSLFAFIELTTIFRQNEVRFIEFLNHIRLGEVSPEILQTINARVTRQEPDTSYIVLCPTNAAVDSINRLKLANIDAPVFTYTATTEGDFPTEGRYLPVEMTLHLKVGARVLFVKNDKGGKWVNGTLGTVVRLDTDTIMVKIDGRREPVVVTVDTWENVRYSVGSAGEIQADVKGRLFQYPLKLAWAITIHKSQGMSFDRVCIDFSRSPFAAGQTYVALSRCRTLDGMLLTRKIYPNDVMIDERIIAFYNRLAS